MRPVIALLLAASIASPPAIFAKKSVPPDRDSRAFQKKLSKDELIRHALDRLTFGPRPGDFEAVRKMGVRKWIDLELHPERLRENPELARKLEPLESLRMSQDDVARNYPAPQLIAAVASGRQQLPDDPVLRAAVERMVQKYIARKGGQDKGDELEPARKINDILGPGQIRILRTGKLDEKRQMLASLSTEQLDDALIAMPRPMRQQLFASVPEETRRKILALNAPQQVVNYDLNEGKLFRAILSTRQLEELLVDFWYNHFNVNLDKGADRYLVPTYERDAIRPHVLGRFRELLEATAHSPAMLFYLDNWQSIAPPAPNPRAKAPRRNARGLNENYARELLELHTLGADGGYTQKDIIEVARCFTGWTIKEPRLGGAFFYNDKVHDKGEKVVLGVTIPAGGNESDGESVLDILGRHPSTARFISKKLAMRFVADDPPAQLIDRMAAAFTRTGGDIRQVMKTMLESKEFASVGAYRAKVKTPFEVITSAVRALDGEVDYTFPLSQQIATLGQPLYRKVEPTGYSSSNADWVNSAALLARMNFALALAQNRIAGVKVNAGSFNPPKVSRETQSAIDNATKDKKPSPGLAAGLFLGSPDFQRR